MALLHFRLWLEEYDDDDQDAADAKAHDDAERYFSIGHGDFSDEHGFEPDYVVWALLYGDIQVGPKNSGTHGTLWGHNQTNLTYKGRFEPQTGRLSIAKPRPGVVPQSLMDMLRAKFRKTRWSPGITSVTEL